MLPKRIQLKRTKGWKKPDNTVVVSRPSKYGNLFVVKEIETDGPYKYGVYRHKSDYLLSRFKSKENATKWAVDMFKCHVVFQKWDIEPLRDKNLACWCKPGAPCHADVLLELANQ